MFTASSLGLAEKGRTMAATATADADSRAGLIRTPDQRVRVFVSSTLQELAAERTAVREAVAGLRLVPVMFESGARPHPPREVYRAYLSQSQVFVGVYWQSYGWVAPGQERSGLEDEYLLSAGMPRLGRQVDEPHPVGEAVAEPARDLDRAGAAAGHRPGRRAQRRHERRPFRGPARSPPGARCSASTWPTTSRPTARR
jgi:hypothetical protein